jgi:hypothetical protein
LGQRGKTVAASAHPGGVKTVLGRSASPLAGSEGGQPSVQLAPLLDDDPSGDYFPLGQRLPWYGGWLVLCGGRRRDGIASS